MGASRFLGESRLEGANTRSAPSPRIGSGRKSIRSEISRPEASTNLQPGGLKIVCASREEEVLQPSNLAD